MRWRVATGGLQRESGQLIERGKRLGPCTGVLPRACCAEASKEALGYNSGLLVPVCALAYQRSLFLTLFSFSEMLEDPFSTVSVCKAALGNTSAPAGI